MTVNQIDPLKDARWDAFVAQHPHATVFHTTGWLDALRRTYGYEPVVFTTSPPDAGLTNGLVACRISSWLTGRRLVAVPFADHCEPLVDSASSYQQLLHRLGSEVDTDRLKYAEVRLLTSGSTTLSGFDASQSFAFHRLDLEPPTSQLFERLHKDGIQRKIRRAEREAIECQEGRSDELLRAFFNLLIITRRRHGVPPQPFDWFRNLRDCLGERLLVRVASKNGFPIASILTLRHKQTLFYKYGGSDAAHHSSGGMPALFWKAIEEGRQAGVRTLDLGRSDLDNLGLITFKSRLGAVPSTLTYLRYPAHLRQRPTGYARMAHHIVSRLPKLFLVQAGRWFYRHAG